MIDSIYWEWFGVINALFYVALASVGKRTCFIFGFISSLIFVDILFGSRLYFEAGINIYYVIMSIVGWFSWKEKDDILHPVSMPSKSFLVVVSAGLVSSLILGYVASKYTNASLTFIDAFTTVMAVIATWMMVRKIIQNWIIWIIADGVSIGMFYVKDHIPMSILFLVYTIIAVYGYRNWIKLSVSS